jgi:hypothetical protein
VTGGIPSNDADFNDSWYQGLNNGKWATLPIAASGPVFLQGAAAKTSGKSFYGLPAVTSRAAVRFASSTVGRSYAMQVVTKLMRDAVRQPAASSGTADVGPAGPLITSLPPRRRAIATGGCLLTVHKMHPNWHAVGRRSEPGATFA